MKKHTPLGINQLIGTTKSKHPDLVLRLEKLWQESASLIETKVKSGNYFLSNEERTRIQAYLDSQNKLRQLGEVNGVNFVHAQLEPVIARIKKGQHIEIESFKPKQSARSFETSQDNQRRLQAMSAIYTFFKDCRIIIIPTTNKANNRREFQRQVKAFAADFREGK